MALSLAHQRSKRAGGKNMAHTSGQIKNVLVLFLDERGATWSSDRCDTFARIVPRPEHAGPGDATASAQGRKP
jgi:hypothetical protein